MVRAVMFTADGVCSSLLRGLHDKPAVDTCLAKNVRVSPITTTIVNNLLHTWAPMVVESAALVLAPFVSLSSLCSQ